MSESLRMLVVLSVICAVCSFLLAGVRSATHERIEDQILRNVQGPAVSQVLAGSTNDLIADRRVLEIDGVPTDVFVGERDDKPWAIAFEVSGKGFGGSLGVMVGFMLKEATLTGIGITAHKETPGCGALVAEPSFSARFKGRELDEDFRTTKDGGVIEAVTGATTSSRAACEAVRMGVARFPRVKEALSEGQP